MPAIEVSGKWSFDSDSISFVFQDGQAIEFGGITDMKTFRAALVAVAKVGSDIYLKSILGDEHPQTPRTASKEDEPQNTTSRVQSQFNSVLERAEASFRDQQKRTEEALKRAQDDYEAATSNVLGNIHGAPGT